MKRSTLSITILAASLALPPAAFAADNPSDKTVPPRADRAATAAPTNGRDASRYSDRERMRAWTGEKDRIEKALQTGQYRAFYRPALEKMGYRITAVNYDEPDYLEYEIVKNGETFEVQIDLDSAGKGRKVDVTTNVWQAEATERALGDRNYRVEFPKTTTPNPGMVSDRERMRTFTSGKDGLEKMLPPGNARDFYRRELEKQGYAITSVNRDSRDYVEYEIVKGTDSYEVQIDLDGAGRAKKVDVTTNMWKADGTTKALQRQ